MSEKEKLEKKVRKEKPLGGGEGGGGGSLYDYVCSRLQQLLSRRCFCLG